VRTPESRGQLTLALTPEDAEAIRELRNRQGFAISGKERRVVIDNGWGWFYVIQVIPDLAPNRVKLGFTKDTESRLQAHRTAAPTAQLVKAWSCKRIWEVAVIDSVTRVGCQLVANEVFDCDDIDVLLSLCDDFFGVMPMRTI